jgi:hypothetical protein
MRKLKSALNVHMDHVSAVMSIDYVRCSCNSDAHTHMYILKRSPAFTLHTHTLFFRVQFSSMSSCTYSFAFSFVTPVSSLSPTSLSLFALFLFVQAPTGREFVTGGYDRTVCWCLRACARVPLMHTRYTSFACQYIYCHLLICVRDEER